MSSNETAREESHPDDLDELEIQILCLLRDTRMYKKEIATTITGWSTASVHRRIDRLHDADLVTSCIKKADADQIRDFFIAFTTTDKGWDRLEEYLVCADQECTAVAERSDHQHEFVPAKQYYR